jgi:hypothetical protein
MPRLLLASCAAVALAGCSLMQTHAQRAAKVEPLLAAAGFQAVPATTPEQLERLKKLPTLQLQYSTRGGKPHYWYADPYRCRCLYTGSEAQYAAYDRLRVEQDIAREERATAIANEDAASIDEQMDYWLPWGEVMWAEPWWGPGPADPGTVGNGAAHLPDTTEP